MRRGALSAVVIALAAILLIGVGYMFFKDMTGPTVTVTPDGGKISPRTIFTITMEDKAGVRELSVAIRKDGKENQLFKRVYEDSPTSYTEKVAVQPASLAGLQAGGEIELVIKATDASLGGFGTGNTTKIAKMVTLDQQPPRLVIKTQPQNVRRGGAGVVHYTVDEDVLSTGVIIANSYPVKAYKQPDGSWICFYPFPYSMSARDFRDTLDIYAEDLAGNVTRARLTVFALERNFRNDRINVSDDFLSRVQLKFADRIPVEIQSPLQGYLYINSTYRAQNMETLRQFTYKSTDTMLWKGVFKAMPRAATRAGFGDHRTLIYNNAVVGEAYHLGFDLASLRQAEIPAANDGVVLYTGDMGIYGNLVLIDHGLGVQTTYSHMTDFTVKPGDTVHKGDTIGHTGSTGLAFGDHLHFGVLVGGLEVAPTEWIDPKWIGNIEKALAQ